MRQQQGENNTRKRTDARSKYSGILRYLASVYTVYKYGSCRDRSRSFAPHPGGRVASDEDLKLNQGRPIVFRDEHRHDHVHVCAAAVVLVLILLLLYI